MCAIYGNICHQYTPNVSIYTIHGSYGGYPHGYGNPHALLPRPLLPQLHGPIADRRWHTQTLIWRRAGAGALVGYRGCQYGKYKEYMWIVRKCQKLTVI